MGVAAQRQAEMTGILRSVIGLGLAAEYRFHDQRLFCRVADVLQHAVEQAGRDHLAQRQLLPERVEIVLERGQLLAAWRFVDAVDDRRGLAFERFRRGDIGRDHEILDHAVGIEPFADRDLGDLAVLVEHHAALGQFQLQRVAAVA